MRRTRMNPVSQLTRRKIRFPRVIVGGLPVAVLDREQTARLTIAAAVPRRGAGRPCLFFTTANGQVVSLCASRSRRAAPVSARPT